MLQNGDGVPMNKEEATKYYKMAIEKGDSNAKYKYEQMLKNDDAKKAQRIGNQIVHYCKKITYFNIIKNFIFVIANINPIFVKNKCNSKKFDFLLTNFELMKTIYDQQNEILYFD